jgi:hypothetical protein
MAKPNIPIAIEKELLQAEVVSISRRLNELSDPSYKQSENFRKMLYVVDLWGSDSLFCYTKENKQRASFVRTAAENFASDTDKGALYSSIKRAVDYQINADLKLNASNRGQIVQEVHKSRFVTEAAKDPESISWIGILTSVAIISAGCSHLQNSRLKR